MPDLQKLQKLQVGDYAKYSDVPQEIRDAQKLWFSAAAPYQGATVYRGTCESYDYMGMGNGVTFRNAIIDSSDRGPHGITFREQVSTHTEFKLLGPWLINIRPIYKDGEPK